MVAASQRKKTAKQTQTVGIVVPAYNESAVIKQVLAGLPTEIDGHPTRIIVVNDGSRDDTAAIVASIPRVTLINHIINMGAGAATRTGLHYARDLGCFVAATIDADGQHRVEDLEAVVHAQLKGSADIVIGNRLQDTQGMVRHRLVGNLGLSLFTYIIFGAWVSDSQSGLKAFSRKALETIQFHSNNYAFCSEIVWRAKQQQLRIAEVPIKAIYTDYSLGKGQSKLNGFNMLRSMVKQRFLGFLHG